jgi:hypothetical protein
MVDRIPLEKWPGKIQLRGFLQLKREGRLLSLKFLALCNRREREVMHPSFDGGLGI